MIGVEFTVGCFLNPLNSGYMAPEYVMHGHLSVKADVFSFGVLVLELISGQRNSSFNLSVDAQNLLDWVRIKSRLDMRCIVPLHFLFFILSVYFPNLTSEMAN